MVGLLPPKVSVCIPVYNGSEYIAETIESVLSQTYGDFQLTVCDNCSTDNTEEIVHRFDDPRLRYLRNSKNLGLVGNTNRCLELATGEYVSILHHDDLMLPDNLERKVRLLDRHLAVGFVHSNILLINSRGEVVSANIWSEDSRRDYIENGFTIFQRHLSSLHLGASIFIGAVLARRECYERLGGFRPALPHCSDVEMWLRLALFYDVACIGTSLTKYRVHPTSTSSQWGYASLGNLKEHLAAASLVLEENKDHIPMADRLKRDVAAAFGRRALDLANGNFSEGDFKAGTQFLKEALNISPGVVRSMLFVKAALKLAAGPLGLRVRETSRRRVG